MRIQIISILLLGSLCHAESISFGNEEPVSVINNEEPELDIVTEREPSSKQEISPKADSKVVESNKKDKLPKYSRVYLDYNLRKGKIFFSQVSVDAEFNSIELIKSNKISSSSFFYNFGLDYMFNKSKAQFYSVLSSIGYEISISDKIVINPSLGFALTYYKEQSNIQNVNSIGNNIFVKTGIDYLVTDTWGINLNIQWNHQIHSQGYWPQKSDSELVFEYITTGIGLVWRLK